MLRLTVLGVVVLAALSPLAASSAYKRAPAKPDPNQNWLSYGHDGQLTNYLKPGLTAAAARRLRQVWTKKLDGGIVASPLYLSGSAPAARTKDTLIAATESGSIYALRAANGAVLWTRKFGVVDSEASCGPWGISSTGAIDLKRGVVYVISADGWLHALDLRNGAEKSGWPIAITAEDEELEYVWGGLRLLRNTLYIPVASYCDAGDEEEFANGRLVAVDVDRAAQTAVFDPVDGDDNLGGIWGWGGASIDPAGQFLFTGVGNSHTFDDDCNCIVDDAGYGDSVVKLRPDLRVSAAGRPTGYPSTGDLDFGSAPLLFRPPGCPPLAAANSKIGAVFVWNRNAMPAGPIANIPVGGGLRLRRTAELLACPPDDLHSRRKPAVGRAAGWRRRRGLLGRQALPLPSAVADEGRFGPGPAADRAGRRRDRRRRVRRRLRGDLGSHGQGAVAVPDERSRSGARDRGEGPDLRR